MMTMAKNEVKYRPATMADIENRDKNLFMNGEQVWVLMIMRSQTVGEREAKLDYITLTNMKKVQVEDLQVIDDGEPEPEGESEELSPVALAFHDRKEKSRGAMLLIRQTHDYYWMLYEDATEAAQVLGLKVEKFFCGNQLVPRIRFHHTKLDTYLPMLIRAGKRPAIQEKIIINNNSNSEDESMKTNENNTETKNVQTAQVTNDIDVQEVEDIAPRVTPKPKAKETPAVTVPLGEHGTMVVGGCGMKPKNAEGVASDKRERSGKQEPEPDPDAVGELAGMLTKVVFSTYKTKKGNDAPIITGFGGDDDPRWKKIFDAKPKWVSAGYRRDLDGNKTYHLMFGSKYMAVAKALADAYNTTDRKAWEKAEQACEANYDSIVNGYKTEKEARKAERQAKREADKPKPEPTGEKTYTLDEVATMLGKLLPEVAEKKEELKALLKAA